MNIAYRHPNNSRKFGMYRLMSVFVHGLLCLLASNCDAEKLSKLQNRNTLEIVVYIVVCIKLRKRHIKSSISTLCDFQPRAVRMNFEEAIATKYLEDHHEQNCLICV